MAFPFLRLKAISILFFFFFALVCGRLTSTMKPHPKLRKTITWGGAAVTVLLVVVWIGSSSYRAVRGSWTMSQTAGLLVLVLLAALWMAVGAHGVMTGRGVGRGKFFEENTGSDALMESVFPFALGAMVLSCVLYQLFIGR